MVYSFHEHSQYLFTQQNLINNSTLSVIGDRIDGLAESGGKVETRMKGRLDHGLKGVNAKMVTHQIFSDSPIKALQAEHAHIDGEVKALQKLSTTEENTKIKREMASQASVDSLRLLLNDMQTSIQLDRTSMGPNIGPVAMQRVMRAKVS